MKETKRDLYIDHVPSSSERREEYREALPWTFTIPNHLPLTFLQLTTNHLQLTLNFQTSQPIIRRGFI